MNGHLKRVLILLLIFTFVFQMAGVTSLSRVQAYADTETAETVDVPEADEAEEMTTEEIDTESPGEIETDGENPPDAADEPAAPEAASEETAEAPVETPAEETVTVEETVKEPAEEEAEAAEAEAPMLKAATKAEKTGTVLAFTSDTHNQSDNKAAVRLGNWIDMVESKHGDIDVMAFGGDMAGAGGNSTSYWTHTQADMNILVEKDVHGVYTTGNHEISYGGDFSYTTYQNNGYSATETKGQFLVNESAAEGTNYRIYCLGSTSGDQTNTGYTSASISELEDYLISVSNDKPIFIITHFPLHYTSSRSTKNAGNVITLLNKYATEKGQKIVFLWGHNHTDANRTNVETHYDEIFAPGESLTYASGSSETLQFYYAAAGCMSDSEYGNGGSAAVKGKGLVVDINSKNQLKFTYYDANGNNITEDGNGGQGTSFTEQDPVAVTGASINEVAPTIEAGKSTQLHYTVDPADATVSSVSWSSSDTSVATVSSSGKVKGINPGSATITVSVSDGITRGTVTASVDVTITERTSTEQYYVITIEKNNVKYALSSHASTEMMSNSSGYEYHGLDAVEYSPDDPAPYSILWSLESVEDVENGYYIKSYNGDYLSGTYVAKPTGSSGSIGTLSVGDTQDVWIANGGFDAWGVAGSTLQSTNSSSSSKALYLGVTTSNNSVEFFTVRSSSDSTVPRTSVLVEPDSILEPVAVSGITLDPESLTLEAGKSAAVTANVLPENADDKTVTWTSSDETVATVNNDGRVRGVSVGTAVITATTNDGNKTANCEVTVTPSSSPGIGYVIAIGEYAMSSNPSSDVLVNAGSGSQEYHYTGLAGVEYDGTSDPSDDILWLIEPTEGGYYIMSQDGQYLNATYGSNSSGGSDGVLKLDDTPDVWILEGSLEDWVLSGSTLKSTNSGKSITHEEGSTSAPLNLFTVRSTGESSSMVDPDTPAEVRFVETNALSTGKDYIVGVTASGNSIYAIENISGTTSGDTGSKTLEVNPANGDDNAYIVTDNTGVVWNYNSSRYLVNNTRYLSRGGSSGAYVPRASGSGSAVTYDSSNKRLSISYSSGWGSGSSTTYYLSNSNGTFGLNTSASSAAQVRLFEKSTVFNFKYVVQFVSNGVNYQSTKYALGEIPAYSAETPTRAETEQYTYTFSGWSSDGGTTIYGPDDALPAVEGPVTYVAQFEATPKEVGHTVTFLAEDGETVIAKVNVNHGTEWDEFDKPEAPEKAGYTFTGWANAPAVITEDVSVTATYIQVHEHNNIDFTAWTSTTSLPTVAGNYYLTENVMLGNTWTTPTGLVNLCLNGHNIVISSTQNNLINISPSSELSIYDCADINGQLTGGRDSTIQVKRGGKLNLYNGSISGNGSDTSNYIGACVYVLSGAEFNMFGGSISGNATGFGAVFGDGEFRMQGGSISDNIGYGAFVKTLYVSGNPIIRNNIYPFDGNTREIDVVLENNNSTIFVNNELGEGASIGIYFNAITSINCSTPFVFTNGLDGKGSISNFISNQEYIISLSNEGEAQVVKEHTFADPDEITYTWATDHSTCTAKHTCTVCNNVVSETVNSTSVVTKPTCTEGGYTTYTANFTTEAFETQTVVADQTDATGHAYGDPTYVWADDHSTCTATRVCANNNEHTETETVNSTNVVTDPSCTAAGYTTYTAAFTNPAFVKQTEVVPGDAATGHNYGEPVWTWTGNDNDGYTAAVATFTCTKCGDTQKPEVTFTITDGTGSDVGKNIYNASTTFNGQTYTDVKRAIKKLTVTFNMMGHGAQIDPQIVEYGKNIDYPVPKTEGWTFKGWYTDESLSDDSLWYAGNSNWVTEDMILYAKWVEKPTAQIAFSDTEKTYNGQDQMPTVTVTAEGMPSEIGWNQYTIYYYSDEECTELLGIDTDYRSGSLNPDGLPVFRPTNAGTYYVKVVVPARSNADWNYYGNEAVGTFTIAKRDVSITPVYTEVTYNGWHQMVSGVTTGEGELVNGHWISGVVYSGQKDAGEYTDGLISINSAYIVEPAGGTRVTENYNLKIVTGEGPYLVIKPAPLTITTESDSKIYDGTALTAPGAVSGLQTPEMGPNAGIKETVGFTVIGSQTDAGSSTNTYEIVWAAEGNNYTAIETNYVINEESVTLGTLTVNKATENNATVTLEGWTYGEASNTPVTTATFGANTAVYTYSTSEDGEYSESVPTTVGTYYVKATIPGTDNYVGAEATASFTISRGSQATPVVGHTDETISGKNDGTITGLTTAMEYSNDGETWIPITDEMLSEGSLTDLTPGTYYVRYAATDNYNASLATEVVIADSTKKLTVTFVDEDGTVLKTAEYDYGTPAANIEKPADPVKEATAQYTYTFSGWTPVITDVTADATYKATYTSTINEYTIKFVDEDGETVLDEQTLAYGVTPVYAGEHPTKEGDAEHSYVFAGWTPAIASVTGDAIYKATYTEATNSYTVTWYDYDGTTVLENDEDVAFGTTPSYDGDTPTRTGDAQYTYTFKGWTPEITPVTGPAQYTATYEATVNKYTIKFVNEDGAVLQSSSVAYGETPEYTGETPVKEATAQYTYTFAGWDKEITLVTGEATYTATYTSTVNKYTVTFVDGDRVIKEAVGYDYGTDWADVEKPDNPVKDGYAFTGWVNTPETVTENVTVNATWTPVKYSIVYNLNGGTNAAANPAEYTIESDAITLADPSWTGHTFSGWYDNAEFTGDPVTTIAKGSTGNVKLYAKWTTNNYTVTWKNFDGTVLKTDQAVPYGTTPEYDDVTPTKAATKDYRYEFAGWDPEIAAVTDDATYTAKFDEIARIYSKVPEWSWTGNDTDGYTSATATFKTNDVAEEFSIPVSDEELDIVTTPAECTETGKTVYTASVEFKGQEYSDSKEVVLPVLNHDWQFVNFTWTGNDEDGYTKAVANYRCKNDNNHTDTVEVAVSVETTPATCEVSGSTVYSATVTEEASLDGVERTDAKTVIINAIGHDWEFVDFTWTESDDAGYTAAVANYKCKNNEEHTQTVNAAVTSVTTDPTCEGTGSTVYTAAVTATDSLDKTEHSDNKTVTIPATGHTAVTDAAVAPTCTETGLTEGSHCSVCGTVLTAQTTVPALGHDWNDPTDEWNNDHTSVDMTFTCKNDPTHTHTETVNGSAITSEITTEPTSAIPGVRTYTATVTLDGKTYTVTDTEVIPATGSTVSGSITSFVGRTEEGQVSVQLFVGDSTEAAYTATVNNNETYTFAGVAAGTYNLTVSKKDHVTRTYEITVNGTAVTQDVKIHLLGDVTGDGKLTTADVSRVNSHVRKIDLITDEYIIKCGDVIGSDGVLTTGDVSRINSHVRKLDYIW